MALAKDSAAAACWYYVATIQPAARDLGSLSVSTMLSVDEVLVAVADFEKTGDGFDPEIAVGNVELVS